jgi:anti-anti-sigma factor
VVNILTMNSTSNAGVLVVEVLGDLDLATAPQLAEAITQGLSTQAAAVAVIVDLTNLDFLACAGMAVIIRGKASAGTSVWFAIAAEGPSTSRPMKIVGLDREIDLYPTVDAALASGT